MNNPATGIYNDGKFLNIDWDDLMKLARFRMFF